MWTRVTNWDGGGKSLEQQATRLLFMYRCNTSGHVPLAQSAYGCSQTQKHPGINSTAKAVKVVTVTVVTLSLPLYHQTVCNHYGNSSCKMSPHRTSKQDLTPSWDFKHSVGRGEGVVCTSVEIWGSFEDPRTVQSAPQTNLWRRFALNCDENKQANKKQRRRTFGFVNFR